MAVEEDMITAGVRMSMLFRQLVHLPLAQIYIARIASRKYTKESPGKQALDLYNPSKESSWYVTL